LTAAAAFRLKPEATLTLEQGRLREEIHGLTTAPAFRLKPEATLTLGQGKTA
jgi:hypothetical protein